MLIKERVLNAHHIAINKVISVLRPDRKIFFIGFNKSATTSIYWLLRRNGIKNAHWEADGQNIALQIEQHLDDEAALKRFLDGWTAFSDLIYISDDLIIEGNRHFALFEKLYPNAYFVLNDRAVDGWIESRKNHRKGELLARYCQFYGMDASAVEDLWRQQYTGHKAAVLEHFAGSSRFLHFQIDKEPHTRLVDFLRGTFSLNPGLWEARNRTNAR